MSDKTYYNTAISDTVSLAGKRYRISVREGVPYVTYKRKTRVLWTGVLGVGAYVNVGPDKIYFR